MIEPVELQVWTCSLSTKLGIIYSQNPAEQKLPTATEPKQKTQEKQTQFIKSYVSNLLHDMYLLYT